MLLRKLLTLVFIFIIVSPCYGQNGIMDSQVNNINDAVAAPDTTSKRGLNYGFPQFWLSAGLTGIDNMQGFELMGSYVRSNHHIMSARYIDTQDPLDIPEGNDVDKIQEISILYGLMADIKYVQASASAGLGWAKQTNELPLGSTIINRNIGIALDARASFNLAVIGVGIQGYGFISQNSYWGGSIFIELGKLW